MRFENTVRKFRNGHVSHFCDRVYYGDTFEATKTPKGWRLTGISHGEDLEYVRHIKQKILAGIEETLAKRDLSPEARAFQWAYKAGHYHVMHEYERAAEAARDSIAASPSARAYRKLGEALMAMKRFEDAAQAFRDGLELPDKQSDHSMMNAWLADCDWEVKHAGMHE